MKITPKLSKGHLYIVMAHYPDISYCDVSRGQVLNLRTNQLLSDMLIDGIELIDDGVYQLIPSENGTELSVIPINDTKHTISLETMVSLMGCSNIDRLSLSIAIQSILTSHGVRTIVDLYDLGIVSLLSIPGIGKHNIECIKRAVLDLYPSMPLPLFTRADLVRTYLELRSKMIVNHQSSG